MAAGVAASWVLLGIRQTPLTQEVVQPPTASSPDRRLGPAHGSIGTAAVSRLLRFHLPIRCGGLHSRLVALTFDDGPGRYTPLALRILGRAHARATFFLVGKELHGRARLPRAELRVGALGDHTWTHRDLFHFIPVSVPQLLALDPPTLAQLRAGLGGCGSHPRAAPS